MTNMWINKLSAKFVAEPYVADVLSRYTDKCQIEKADYLRKCKEDLIKSSDFVYKKYTLYSRLLAERLNHIHDTDYSLLYWQKALSLPLARYITLVHDSFALWEANFDPRIHEANILSKHSFAMPNNFEEQRELLQASDLGQEQLFSIYLSTFHRKSIRTQQQLPHSQYSLVASLSQVVIRILKKFSSNQVKSPRSASQNPNIHLGLLGVYFSKGIIEQLKEKSKGNIDVLFWPKIQYSKAVNKKVRRYLSKSDPSFDRFDLYFFQTMYSLFPRFFLEEYKNIQCLFSGYFATLPNLKVIVSECWIFSTPAAFAIAELFRKTKIKHISCEHNILSHPMAGNYIEYLAPLCDEYTTIGWSSTMYSNISPGASLLPFYNLTDVQYSSERETLSILYISGAVQVKVPLYWSQYGLSAENSRKHFDFIYDFFKNLPLKLFAALHYRPYPKKSNQLMTYDKEDFLKEFPLNFISAVENPRLQMLRSRLVIVDYISTAHLEAISLNVPTIFFFDRDSYYLRDDFITFFDDLINVGVCQTDPLEAARFVTTVFEDPMKWWTSAPVENAISNFLKNNLGKPEVMINKLLKELNQKTL